MGTCKARQVLRAPALSNLVIRLRSVGGEALVEDSSAVPFMGNPG